MYMFRQLHETQFRPVQNLIEIQVGQVRQVFLAELIDRHVHGVVVVVVVVLNSDRSRSRDF
jgi:hypothetical protein